MENIVLLSREEYDGIKETCDATKDALQELKRGHTVVGTFHDLPCKSIGDIQKNVPAFVFTKDESVNALTKRVITLESDCSEMYKDIMKIPAFVRRLFGVK